jgi:predicted cupin superfamily sugar epimerase
MLNADQLIKLLQLQPHPEGGFYRETYRSTESVKHAGLPQRYSGDRSFSTGIYFLLTAGNFSAMHTVAGDEMFHFYFGDAVEMLLLDPDGGSRTIRLGHALDKGELPQFLVPHGWWQGSRLIDGGKYALLGCTVAPGFDFADFELGSRKTLQSQFPKAAEMIGRLTRS